MWGEHAQPPSASEGLPEPSETHGFSPNWKCISEGSFRSSEAWGGLVVSLSLQT